MNEPSEYDLSQLHDAAAVVERGDLAEQTEFVRNGFNLLTLLVRLNRLDLVNRLLDRGFPIDLNNRGYVCSALTQAAYLGDIQAIRLLVARGAAVQGHENQDLTPLHEAPREGHLDAVKELIGLGAKVGALGIHDQTVLEVARGDEVREFVRIAMSLERLR